MKAEHEELLIAMARFILEKRPLLEEPELEDIAEDVRLLLDAAADRGYVLAKLPEPQADEEPGYDEGWEEPGYDEGWNDCLDAIEIVELDDEA